MVWALATPPRTGPRPIQRAPNRKVTDDAVRIGDSSTIAAPLILSFPRPARAVKMFGVGSICDWAPRFVASVAVEDVATAHARSFARAPKHGEARGTTCADRTKARFSYLALVLSKEVLCGPHVA